MLKRHSRDRQAPATRTTSIEPISLRILDAAKFTGLSRSKIYELIGAGKLQTVKVGKVTLCRTSVTPAIRYTLAKAAKGKKNAWFKTVGWMEDAARDIIAPDLVNASRNLQQPIWALYDWFKNV